MTTHGPTPSGRQAAGTLFVVDASYAGSSPNGSDEQPWTTIQDGIDGAAAGDNILIRPGAYVEDLALADGVNLQAIGDELVTVTGTATCNDAGLTIEGISFIDDGAGSALDVTGTAAETLILKNCLLTSTATGDQVLTNTNTNQTIELNHCELVANATVLDGEKRRTQNLRLEDIPGVEPEPPADAEPEGGPDDE